MRLPASERARWALIVAVGIVAFVAMDLWWVLTYRDGYPMNVDEAGYTSIALNNHLAFENFGVRGWWSSVQTQTPNAPLLPALTSVLMVVKTGLMEGYVVLIGFFALLIAAAYGIGERLAGPRLGALGAFVVATSEGALLFSREFVFAIPTAAMLACAVYALLRSERMRSTPWAIACGASIGLMLLARTMAIAFVPGLFAAALIAMLAVERTDLPRRFLNLGLAALSAALVAAAWYWNNLQPVLDYLTNYGYGARSDYYGAETSTVSWGRFRAVADRVITDDLLVPLAALVVVAFIALAVVAVRRVLAAEDRREAVLRLAASDAVAVGIVIAAGFAALMTSQNGGNGFTLPIAMLMPPLAVVALRFYRAVALPAAALLAAIGLLNLAATSNLWQDLAKFRSVEVPGFDYQAWLNGTPRSVGAVRAQVPGPSTQFTERDGGWLEADAELSRMLLDRIYTGTLPNGLTVFASRHRAISTNSLQVAALLYHRTSLPLTQLESEPGGDTVANYEHQLTDPEKGLPSLLVTMNRNTDDFDPLVTQAKAEAAARRVGFRREQTMALPDGRQLRLWVRRAPEPPDTTLSRRSSPARGEPAGERGSPRG
ncbi:MAG TPA: glycosyltransferase family 39 protein [Solirubrobacterales bacterium]|nr:glycosyltransferase family 39 protein [Solirubrobacterales bacterium]